jgi:ribulose-bisphosphate carboxylase large chain
LSAISILGHGDAVRDMAFFAKEAGPHAVLIIPGLLGFDAINRLAQDPGFGLPIMAHPSHLGPYVLSADTGYSHPVLFGTLMRLAVADITVFPNHGGSLLCYGPDIGNAIREMRAALSP